MSESTRSAAQRKIWAGLTPEEREAKQRKMAAGRKRAREQKKRQENGGPSIFKKAELAAEFIEVAGGVQEALQILEFSELGAALERGACTLEYRSNADLDPLEGQVSHWGRDEKSPSDE